MADLLADPVKETWRQMAVNDPTGVESLAPKQIDPNAQIKLAARDKAADPFAGLDEVKNDAFAGLEEVKTEDAFSGLQPADSLDVKDTQALVDDDTFRPADYLAANPNLRTDAEKSKKLIDVYRARQIRGLQAGKVLKAAATEAPGIVAKTVKGVRDLGARIIETGIQPAATSVLATLTGASVEEKAAIMAEQGKEQLKAVGEVTAGTEAAVTGLAQLGQQGMRKLFGKSPEKMSDSELLDQLYFDSEFSKTIAEVAEGKGDAVKAAGLDADTLAKNGVILDKEAIEHLSLVDPVTLVATAGAFKVVGLGGRVLATAANRAGAQAVITGLGNLVKTVGSKSVEAAGKTAEVIGKTVQPIAERLPAKSVGFVLGATKTGTLQGGAIGAAAGEAAKRIGVETASALAKRGARVAELGGQLNPSFIGPRSAGLSRLLSLPSTTAGQIATRTAGGAVQGAVTALPLVAASDDSQTAGALLGGGIALGAIHGVAAGGKAAIAETVAKNYLDPHNIPFEKTNSPGYGVDVKLDALHDAAIAKLPEHEQNAVNAFREAVREGGGEIYVQDGKSYGERVRENQIAENGGKPLTPEQEAQAALYTSTHAFFDGMIPDANGEARRVVFLNSDSTGIHHDSGHLFQALLSPENQAALRESALSSYSKEQIQAFKDEYARRIGEPDYFDKLGDQADFKAADELIAENFGQLFQNKTFADLSAPRPFLKKLGDVAVQAGEALGFDLTAGRTTADLGAKPSFRLQDLLRNAAQDVLTRESTTPAAPVEPSKLKMVEPADVKPVEAAPVKITPAEVLPKEPVSPTGEKPVVSETPPSTAKNIRTTRPEQSDFASKRAEETGISEAQKATESDPVTRKTVDTIAESMQRGNPVLEIEHLGIVSERGPAAPEGRTSRRGTQEAGYQELERLQIENRAEAPADIVDLHQKTFVPVRFTTQGGKPTLIAMSLDKVIANVRKVVGDAVANKAESLLPYPVENGKLTDAGWKQAISDVQAYAENQSNGFRGDGQKLVRPTEDIGVSLPAENPNYTPKTLSEGAMNFSNLVQGLNPPETGRVQKGLTPGNVKGQLLAEINKKQPMTPAVIKPENVTKQAFKGFEPRTVKETNPLRNELAARGVKVRELLEVTERLAVKDIASVKPREDIAFKAPVTDIIRSGFLPSEKPVAELGPEIQKMSPEDWKSFVEEGGGSLTRRAYELGLGLKDKAHLEQLRQFQADLDQRAKSAVQQFRETGSDVAMQEASLNGLKSQFFREATEAATDTGSAANPRMGWRRVMPDAKPPFAEPKAEAAKFLPRTEAGKKAAQDGVEFEMTGDVGNRSIRIKKGGVEVGDVTSSSNSFTGDLSKAIIAGTNVQKSLRGKGIGEAAYRELLTQLKEDGVTEVGGMTVSGAPIVIREKVFGKGSTKIQDVGGSERGTISVEQALAELNDGGLGFEATNKITPESKFLPKKHTPKSEFTQELLKKTGWEISFHSMGPDDFMFTLRDGNNLVSDLSIHRDPEIKDFAEVGEIETTLKYRGKGAAEALYREAATKLQELGVTRLGGNFLTQAPMNLRKKLFGEFEMLGDDLQAFSEEEARSRLPETPADSLEDSVGRRTGKVEGVSTIDPDVKFLPKRRKVEESDIAPKKKTAAKAPKAGSATGWILPNQEFVPLNDAFHENFLATNADSLNTKFGTKFASTPDVDARKDALNKGFVRIRYTPATGAAMVELNARYWTPKTRQALMKQLEGRLDSIDKLQVSLLNDKGGVIDAMSAGRFDMEAPERLTAFEEGLSGLRGGSAKFLPKLPNRKDYGYIGDVQDGEVRAAAVNLATKTHSEMGLESMWRYNPLTKKVYWWDTAERNSHSDLVKEELEAAGHEVVGNRMVTTDISTYNEAHANSEKYPARDYFRNTKFLPSETGTLPGLKMPSQQDRVKSRIAKAKNSFPEALPPRYEKDDAGKFVMDEDGKPKPVLEEYRFDETPVAREAAKGLRGDEREEAAISAIGNKLVKAAKTAQKNPDIAAGVTWYSTARRRLKKLLGDDSKFFSELLGATSARTPVETNFRFALDAYNEFKRGNYDAILKKYREGKKNWETGKIQDFPGEDVPTREQYLGWWVTENELTPLQSNGRKFAMNSQAVLKVLDGSWAEEVGGPKTPNFAGNLSGQTFEATIDVWASRLIHRLANEGNEKPWRILPENETGLSDADFALGQKIFRKAAEKLGMKPDALQAILWFAEKDHWEKNGWTRGAGAEKSDFNVLLKETELTPSGILKQKTPQKEFDLGLSEDDIKSKNK